MEYMGIYSKKLIKHKCCFLKSSINVYSFMYNTCIDCLSIKIVAFD